MALNNGVWLVGGTIPERHQGQLHNTCTVYSPDGKFVTKYQKVNVPFRASPLSPTIDAPL